MVRRLEYRFTPLIARPRSLRPRSTSRRIGVPEASPGPSHVALDNQPVPAFTFTGFPMVLVQKLQRTIPLLATAFLLSGCSWEGKDIPRSKKIADPGTNPVAATITWPTGKMFHVVLGVPHANTNALRFAGELSFGRKTGSVARITVSSEHATRCNWLENQAGDPQLAGYILTWTNTGVRETFNHLLAQGESYDFQAVFSEAPPPGSSLWLHWLGTD